MSQATNIQKEKASFQLFTVLLICNVMINGTLHTPIFCHSDKGQLLGSRLGQWNLLEKGVLFDFSITTKKMQLFLAYLFLQGSICFGRFLHPS